MLVKDVKKAVSEISEHSYFAADTETTGLSAYKGDRIFSVIISTPDETYYFDRPSPLDYKELQKLFGDPTKTIYMHNAKFDWHMFHAEGIEIKANVICTMASFRLINNDLPSYSMDYLAKRLGTFKDDQVKKYLQKEKLFDWVTVPGKKLRQKNFHYDQVPLEIMQPYAEQDTKVTLDFRDHIEKRVTLYDEDLPEGKPTTGQVYENEAKLTRVLFGMESTGIQLDIDYTQRAWDFERARFEAAKEEFEIHADEELTDSNKALSKIWKRFNLPTGVTPKGQPSVTDEIISKVNHPVAQALLKYRKAYKKANTYYANFIHLADPQGVIHCNFFQSGTATGRMSSSNPNLQNIHKDFDKEDEFVPRRCFVPRPGFFFAMVDYDQMEYRLMLDYAREEKLIEEILGGKDVHQATADLVGLDRQTAKNINFALLYGAGVRKFALMAGISEMKAKDLRDHYFRKLPRVKKFINKVIKTTEQRGFIFNWMGRRCFLKRDFAYKAPNYLIQGGCADIVKVAMINIDNFMKENPQVVGNSRMLLNVHDELVFEVDEKCDYETMMDRIPEIMKSAYPSKMIPLTCGVDWSKDNWADKRAWGK